MQISRVQLKTQRATNKWHKWQINDIWDNHELTTVKNTIEVTSKQVLALVWRVDIQKAMSATIQETKEFNMVRYTKNPNCETIKQK